MATGILQAYCTKRRTLDATPSSEKRLGAACCRAWFLFLILALACSCTNRDKERVAQRSERLEVTDGLVAAYDFEEGTGTTTADVSGTGNLGTLSGPTWVTNGRRGKALSFDGTDDRVTVAGSPSLELTSGMTLMAWAKPAVRPADWQTLILKEHDSDNFCYALYVADDTGIAKGYVNTTGTGGFIAADHRPLRTDRWTHLAATYDGTALSVYMNGSLSSSTEADGTVWTSDDLLSIGGNAVWGEWFNGLLDEVRVYNRGLSESEVALEMGGLAPAPAPTLVAAYGFEEGSGDITSDASGHSNGGTLAGATWSTTGKHGGAAVD